MSRTARPRAETEFGQRLVALLVEARQRSNKSVKEVAERSGVGIHGLYAVERGQVLSPGVRTVYLLSREYGLDLGDLARRASGEGL